MLGTESAAELTAEIGYGTFDVLLAGKDYGNLIHMSAVKTAPSGWARPGVSCQR